LEENLSMNKTVFLQTYGCQMNERDSEEVLGMLTAQGYEVVEQPEAADVILLNTCSVRAHAEERAFGKMGELSLLMLEKPQLVLGIIGCMAKLRQGEIFKRLPKVDLVAGPAELYDLPYVLAELQEKRQSWDRGQGTGDKNNTARVMAVGRTVRPLDARPPGEYRRPGVAAFVTIMEGCDKACAYCIVPKTRGQEISRPAEEIVEEINGLVDAGYQEVTLLGQNVNSYGKRFPDGTGYQGPLGRLRLLEEDPETLLDFPQLLRLIDRRANVPRVRFTTSHPFDATERLFAAMRDCESVCEWLHLPVQSGSDRMLRAMRRGYTAQAYLAKVERLRELVPEVSLSTDIIVGFPGETDEDFQATIRLMREVRYDHAYIFKYSPRPGTDAAAREDDVPKAVKEARNQVLLALQQEISEHVHRKLEGSLVEILVEEQGKFEGQWFGRTRGNQGVIVPACRAEPGMGERGAGRPARASSQAAGRESPESLLGQTVQARITRATAHTLFGALESAGGPSRPFAEDDAACHRVSRTHRGREISDRD
jgi:tRNA-2-methylthio-N6-dimethylallyladenosine synthase